MVLSAGPVSVDTRLLLEAEQGSPDALQSVDLYLSAPAAPAPSGDPWTGASNRAASRCAGRVRLPGVEAATGPGSRWAWRDPAGRRAPSHRPAPRRVLAGHFNRPLAVHETVVLHAVLTPKPGEKLWPSR